MKMDNKSKFLELVSEKDTKFSEYLNWSDENRTWLRKSKKIAFAILNALDENKDKGITPSSQAQLAKELKLSKQQVNKWVKGKENFTIETISKIESALDISLIEILFHDEKRNKEIQESKKQAGTIQKGTLSQRPKLPAYDKKNTKTKVIPLNKNNTWADSKEKEATA